MFIPCLRCQSVNHVGTYHLLLRLLSGFYYSMKGWRCLMRCYCLGKQGLCGQDGEDANGSNHFFVSPLNAVKVHVCLFSSIDRTFFFVLALCFEFSSVMSMMMLSVLSVSSRILDSA